MQTKTCVKETPDKNKENTENALGYFMWWSAANKKTVK